MKPCPFCAEQIQDDAIKCRFCGEFLNKREPQLPWYFSNKFMMIILMCFGPFVLPLIILHPAMSKTKKIIFSILLIGFTYYLMHAFSTARQMVDEIGQSLDIENLL